MDTLGGANRSDPELAHDTVYDMKMNRSVRTTGSRIVDTDGIVSRAESSNGTAEMLNRDGRTD